MHKGSRFVEQIAETAGPSTTLRSGRDDNSSCAINLSSRPERTRISCHAAPDIAACAAFRKESRMKLANATGLDQEIRGSVVEGPAVSIFLFS